VAHETQGHTISGHSPAELVGIKDIFYLVIDIECASDKWFKKGLCKGWLFAKRWHTRFK
jgi:hypothetical protein